MSTITTPHTPAAWSPDVFTFAPAETVGESLIMQTATVAGRVEGDAPAVRAAYVDDAAAQFTAEGEVIPEADPSLSEVIVHTGKVTQLVRLSAEQWMQPGVSQQLSQSVQRAVVKAADRAYIAQAAPIAPAITPPAGLQNLAGITHGGQVTKNLDALIDLFAGIEAKGGTPSHILVAPDAWATLRKMKTGTGSAQNILGAGTNDAARMLLDVPVLVSSSLDAGTGMIVDSTAIIAAVGDVKVAQSEHAYFAADSIALRCTWRFGANVVRPERIATFTVG